MLHWRIHVGLAAESEPSSGPEDAWLQQQQAHPGSPSAGGADADVPPAPSLTREDWMTVPMARSLAPQLDKQPEKAEQVGYHLSTYVVCTNRTSCEETRCLLPSNQVCSLHATQLQPACYSVEQQLVALFAGISIGLQHQPLDKRHTDMLVANCVLLCFCLCLPAPSHSPKRPLWWLASAT